MAGYRASVIHEFVAGHRLWGPDISCQYPHGHTFRAEVSAWSSAITDVGMVVDFDELRSAIANWINENWDHSFLVNSKDYEMVQALSTLSEARVVTFEQENPTAEVLARRLYETIKKMNKFSNLSLRVRIWENDNQFGEYGEVSL